MESSNSNRDRDSVVIRKAKREDCFAIMELKKELAAHQNMGGLPMLSVEGIIPPRRCLELQKDGFDTEPPLYQCIVAEIAEGDNTDEHQQSSRIVGYALYFYAFAVWEGKALHLEDLCVSGRARGKGAGSRLLKELAKIALEEKCARMQLEVLDWNAIGLKFYNAHGGWNSTTGEGWHNFRIDRAAIEALVVNSQ